MATRKKRGAFGAPMPSSAATFEDVSRANSHVALMEELHGTDSPQHKEALAERQSTIDRYRQRTKDGGDGASAA